MDAHKQPNQNDLYKGAGIYISVPKCPVCKLIDCRYIINRSGIFNFEYEFEDLGSIYHILKCTKCQCFFKFSKETLQPNISSINCCNVLKEFIEDILGEDISVSEDI